MKWIKSLRDRLGIKLKQLHCKHNNVPVKPIGLPLVRCTKCGKVS